MKHIGTDPNAVTEYDDDKVQSNIALLGFKTAVNGSLAKYNLQDQIIDEYEDATGIDAGASTNERLTAGVYDGTSSAVPTRTQDADATDTDGDYTWFKWTDTAATGSYSADVNETAEFLVVAGGGGGGAVRGGGGGAGGLRASYGSVSGGGASAQTDLSLISGTTYTMTVGAGGAGEEGSGYSGSNGDDGSASSITGSDIDDVTTVGGGGGLGNGSGSINGRTGGSGGGMTSSQSGRTAGAGTANEGYAGGTWVSGSSCGGGGAAAVGAAGDTSNGGAGGAGLNITITGSSVGYAGGGGGGGGAGDGGGTATHGGGAGTGSGVTPAPSGTANTGGGGGGVFDDNNYVGGDGGSGVVIIRVPTNTITSGGDLTLQSTDTTASTANPDYADMVCLIEDAEGTATLNTDIKGYISEDSGVTFTEGTFVDEGSWGTNKKIIAFHDLDISAQSGSSMCYKITTHNQSASSKETRIYATSLGWR